MLTVPIFSVRRSIPHSTEVPKSMTLMMESGFLVA